MPNSNNGEANSNVINKMFEKNDIIFIQKINTTKAISYDKNIQDIEIDNKSSHDDFKIHIDMEII
ncbi:hypothetical protein SLITO_v1c05860 [Spiroplasma litorale]|uniref:Uncharacterized protein n=1 Tax=Spiroplasma litorale TaxID=216942 RepID=A0A0K1W1M3_9MOLU|nr:hypothetical protein [Spiroplasma litorale]AKX34220.1 hypothetical protein SLITO_v1c05860 [Spiroplasma litorale]